jgi:AcrR family transcriptional regulator
VTVPPRGRRDDLLNAAERVLSRGGPQALTLQAVADEAGTSKGGLLYHFSTKAALVSALVDRLVADMDAGIAAHGGEGGPGAYTRAYLTTTMRGLTAADSDVRLRRWAVILAACTEPGMQDSISAAFERWMVERPGDDEKPLRALVARLAADGLWWNAQFVAGFRDPALTGRIETALRAYLVGDDKRADVDGDDDTAPAT